MMTRETRPAIPASGRTIETSSIFLAMLVAIIVVPTLGPVGLLGRLLGDALVSLMLVSGAAAVADRPRTVLIVSVITGATLLVRWASWLFPTADLAVWREISTLATLGVLCFVVLRLVLRRGPITARRIEGAIAVYLLLGLTWAHAYGLVALWDPGAFTGAVDGGARCRGRILQLRDADDDGLRGHHARTSPRACARGAGGADRTALSRDHAGSPRVAGTAVPAGRVTPAAAE